MSDKKLFDDPIFRFLTREISKLNSEISRNKIDIKRLASRQTELKRGRTELVKLRRIVKDKINHAD